MSSSSSTILLLELIRCVIFQSLKSEYNQVLSSDLLPGYSNSNNNNSKNTPRTTTSSSIPPYILGKVKRNIAENFHRWYFDAAGTISRTSCSTSSSSSKKGEQEEDPLLISPSKLFENSDVKNRIIDTLQQTLTVSKQPELQQPPSREKIEAALAKIEKHYRLIFDEFQRVSSHLNNNNTNNKTQLKLDEPTQNSSGNHDKGNRPSSSSSSSIFWISINVSDLIMNERNSALYSCLESSKILSSFFISNTTANSQNNNDSNNKGAVVCLPLEGERLKKLARVFFLHQNSNNNDQKNIHDQNFLKSAMQMLLRYSALSDEKLQLVPRVDDSDNNHTTTSSSSNNNNNNNHQQLHRQFLSRSALSGLGQHSAVPSAVMKVIDESVNVSFECFASPLNAHFDRFCSAFVDTDSCFGSQGSFFDLLLPSSSECFLTKNKQEGISFELNPPFVEDVMERARQKAVEILHFGEDNNIPYSFLIFLPHWVTPPTASITNIRRNDSNFLKGELILKPNEHGYIDGSQHRVGKGSAQYNAGHESVVFVLQNSLGMKKWPFGEEVKDKIKSAFGESVVASSMMNFSATSTSSSNNNRNNNRNRRERE